MIGKDEPVRIFSLVGDDSVKTEAWFSDASELNTTFLIITADKKWDEAIAFLAKLEGIPELDLSTLISLYRDRISVYREQELDPDWDGVYAATSK